MTLLEVQLKDRTLTVTFEHPWKIMRMRGEQGVPVKVTNCTIVENRPTLDGDKKPRVRFLTHGFVKWPLIAKIGEKGEILKGNTTSTLPTEKLSKDRARRMALTRALWPNLDPKTGKRFSPFTREERARIWGSYNTTFMSSGGGGSTPSPVITPMPAMITAAMTFPSKEIVPAPGVPGVVSKVVAFPQHHRPSPFAFWSPSSQTVH